MSEPVVQAPAPALPFTLRSIYLRNSETFMAEWLDPLALTHPLVPLLRSGDGRVNRRTASFANPQGDEQTVKSCTLINRYEFIYVRAHEGSDPSNEEVSDEDTAVRIVAEITADYLINTPGFPDQELLNKWGQSNVLLHTWPYWREFCHATQARMSLPLTMVPMVQFGPPPTTPE
jgi:hypothetical protein